MPKQKGRGKIVRTRTMSTKDGYRRCDVYEKEGPRGGKTVCGPLRKRKAAKGRK